MYLGIPGFPPGMPYGFVRIICIYFYFFFFLFFRRQGFRMIIFDRQPDRSRILTGHMSWS